MHSQKIPVVILHNRPPVRSRLSAIKPLPNLEYDFLGNVDLETACSICQKMYSHKAEERRH
jgi:hypothetical protein